MRCVDDAYGFHPRHHLPPHLRGHGKFRLLVKKIMAAIITFQVQDIDLC